MKKIFFLLRKCIPTIGQILFVVLIVATGYLAYNMGVRENRTLPNTQPDGPANAMPAKSSHPADLNGDGLIYTCSMHPQIQQDEPGKCPICGMELVDVNVADANNQSTSDSDNGMSTNPAGGQSERQLSMSREAMALADIQTSLVMRDVPVKEIRLVGELAIDPSRRAHISADVGGRIDKLSADYEGDVVEKGEDLVLLYSPELLAVQGEYLQARKTLAQLPPTALEGVREASERAIDAARDRLRLAGLSSDQIDAIAVEGKAREQVILKAPISGTVIERHAEEGQYVGKGERILTIAGLDVLWGELEAYESDLPWLRVGQPMTFTSDAFPGQIFKGELAWFDPIMNSKTRTSRVRVNIDNDMGLLKPGMYVTGRIDATLNGEDEMLVIPQTAPLITGERAVVYVQLPDADRPAFEGREVVLGPKTKSGYVVVEGLSEGERVVTHGAFQIDSALQIIAKPSMMNPGGGRTMSEHEGHGMAMEEVGEMSSGAAPPLNKDELANLLEDYLDIQRALADDDFQSAVKAWQKLGKYQSLMTNHSIHHAISNGESAKNIEELRISFEPLSLYLIQRIEEKGSPSSQTIRLVHCPMAFDFKGADWLQTESEVSNPYFGAAMLKCGTINKEFAPQ